jgi:hypothetical protein
MAKDLTVILEDRPGTAADMGEALGKAGVNMEGGCGFRSEGKGVVHILVEDAVAAKKVLQQAGIEVRDEREVLVLKIGEDRPGVMGDITRRIAQAGVNIELMYIATNNRLVIGVDDIDKARTAV